LRLWLRRLSRCRRLLKLRLLSQAIRGERIVVNEIRLIVHRHQRVADSVLSDSKKPAADFPARV
jgi:hypothetical protein